MYIRRGKKNEWISGTCAKKKLDNRKRLLKNNFKAWKRNRKQWRNKRSNNGANQKKVTRWEMSFYGVHWWQWQILDAIQFPAIVKKKEIDTAAHFAFVEKATLHAENDFTDFCIPLQGPTLHILPSPDTLRNFPAPPTHSGKLCLACSPKTVHVTSLAEFLLRCHCVQSSRHW